MRTRRSQSSSDPVSEEHRRSSSLGVGPKAGHQAVLLHEAVDALDVRPSDTLVDCTLGGAGHARELAAKLGREGLFVGFDLDSDAIHRAEEALSGVALKKVLIQANFRDLARELRSRGIERADKFLFDLGWSSFQLDAGRGFSFQSNEPLSMTYAKEGNALTAKTIVNDWQESSIADVLYGWGQERYARRIARAIVERRAAQPFRTARELAECIASAVPPSYRHARTHPATKTFQALRIATNDEMGALQEALAGVRELLSPGGRVAVISFHSLEDRIVKRTFLAWEKEGIGSRLTKKPEVASAQELARNPRARSAKLRTFQRTT